MLLGTNREYIPAYSINWMVYVKHSASVYSAVGTKFKYGSDEYSVCKPRKPPDVIFYRKITGKSLA